ncbi:hypothetical protein DBR23_03630 [Acidovorax sp. HMWF018]|uniref:phage tail fiber protein n=1 Tax=Acidovorax sp. HMWF018 TaxID=2056855 RepID=UPI000D3CDE37|nr:hypothetical protein [Acidovorax sp. HMWF018]MBI2750807.1 hypothetical protein [Burkholderiales bacterium]PTT42357.1 hypothetical protein DBR23_03630 [Acidovorax sp. HMWF018]
MTIHYPAEGRNHILDVVLHGATQVAEWRVAPYEGDYTPQDDDTAANIVARATEITAYSEATRPAFVESAASNGASDNTGNYAQFTLTAEKTVRAFAIVSSAGKGSTTGVLLAIQKLNAPVTYPAGTVVRVPVLLTLSNPA